MDWLKLNRVVIRQFGCVGLRHSQSQMSSLAQSDHRDSSVLSSDTVLSPESKERCIAKLRKMKPLRPVNVAVKQRAAVLGWYGESRLLS